MEYNLIYVKRIKIISKININFSWCVVVAKDVIYSNHLVNSSEAFFHCKIVDGKKELNCSKLNDTHVLVYKKKAVFESVLKNIFSGKFYEVELKHLIILLSVIVFFFLVSFCKADYSNLDNFNNLSFFEEKVCVNKKYIISSIAVMFIVSIVSGMIKKKLNKKKVNKIN